MKLSTKSPEYIIPEYSLTGDLLSFLTCNLQYRYQNKGDLPPSMPIQLWFGEFIHGTLEEAFLKWKNLSEDEKNNFPWDWEEDIKPIEDLITGRLKINGLNPPMEYQVNYGPKDNIFSARVERSINLWGPHLFPLIDDSEVLIKGIREMPIEGNDARSDYYSINGVVDVLSSIKLDEISQLNTRKTNRLRSSSDANQLNKKNSFQQTLDNYLIISSDDVNNFNKDKSENLLDESNPKNKILEYLANNKEFNSFLKNHESEDYEIIIDYKGMRRPSAPIRTNLNSLQNETLISADAISSEDKLNNDFKDFEEEYENYKTWIQHEWQILTYSWLRNHQLNEKKVIAGIIFYLNELVPSTDDLVAIREDLKNNETDIRKENLPKEDLDRLMNWDEKFDLPIHRDLSDKFKMDRSIRIITIDDDLIDDSLNEFDKVVKQIESSTIKEMNGLKIKEAWKADAEDRTCSACDFRTFCDKKRDDDSKNQPVFTVP